MGYEVHVYHSDVFDEVEEGWELDEIPKPELNDGDVDLLRERLEDFGYEPESTDDSASYVRELEGCLILVDVFATEVLFTIPDGEDCNDAVDEALGDAAELTTGMSMIIYDPQTEEWLEP